MSGDGMDHLRIPFEKIKFGRKLEVQGYGTIYEGEFDGQKVALKQLNVTNLVNVKPRILAEILAIFRFREHPNVVALLGFCDEKSNEIILVYEYVGSGNLADKMMKRLNTIQRLEICVGAARGLDYLHTGVDEPSTTAVISIVHGNIKPSKILLNSNSTGFGFDAKISSFGLSKMVPGQSRKNLEPVEPATKESDVYSFGVLLLEVLCGVSELVDTDDYQERHVSELVPKRLEQNKLRKVVHFDIRKEIKELALETYSKIACECVNESPEARPTMARVVEELENALILQGGVVSPVHIPSSINVAQNETVVEAGPKEDDNDVTVDSNVPENEPEVVGENKLDVARDYNSDAIASETMEEQSSLVSVSDSLERESVNGTTDAEKESSNNEPLTTDDISSNKESTILDNEVLSSVILESGSRDFEALPNENDADEVLGDELQKALKLQGGEVSDVYILGSGNGNGLTEGTVNVHDQEGVDITAREDQSIPETTHIKDAQEESSNDVSITTNGPETTREVIDKSIINEVVELEDLRIPFDEIKFGKKIDMRGYGTLFEGEYSNQQVALKRLNLTNLNNIKPKLLAEILNVARFRKHPNVVALIGFCDEKSNEIVLVYEYVKSGNLADKMNKHLNTIQRLEICLDAARGLEYLHTGIVHGHVKLSKILLNSESNSSRFKAKVSGFGFSKLLPGDVQIAPRSMDPAAKESDVYTFGVLLLEVLCGVPELVDTDDYQERHVTELVLKRLEQDNLRKIVHFDIRNEIKTEALETYGKIACRCVMKSPEERPGMAEVVIELEKALRLQGGEVSDVYILGSGKGNGLTEGTVNVHDQEGDDTSETMSSYIADDEYKVTEETVDITAPADQSSSVPISDVIDAESIPETTHIKDAESIPETMHIKDAESIPETTHIKDAESIPETTHIKYAESIPETTHIKKDAESIPETTHIKDAESIPEATHSKDAQEKSSNDVSITTNGRETTSKVSNGYIGVSHQEIHAEVLELEDLRIPFDEIKFGKKIDMRGYGTLFEGEYSNQQVALKRLNITNLNNIKPKLLDEILTVARFRKHPNIVALIGFCDEKSNEIVLVYEYVKSGNLADKMSKHLNTIQRLEICLGAARGLEYLHTGIVHGHIKLSKILLNLDSSSSRFEAKVSGFGFSKLLPGDVQIAPRSMDPAAKESDVYTFGVLLLEVLCGVPELVDTDDYQERHVTEVVPKRLEQDMLRKIVHFDIRNDIKTEALETYAKIACRSVVKNPEERPTMTEVVIELEKALRLQGGEVSSIHILATKETVVEVDQPEDDKPEEEPKVVNETIANDETEESKVVDETIDDIVDAKPNEEPVIIEVPTREESKNDADGNSSKLLHSFHRPVLATKTDTKDSKEEKDNKDDTESKEETMENKITPLEVTTDQRNDGKHSLLLKTGPEPELSVNTRGDFDDFNPDENLIPVQKPEVSEIKRSNSACSESSNDDGTTPTDYLLPKSPTNDATKKKTLTSSGNCCCCSLMCFICDSIVFYGGQLWDKLVSCFAWIGGRCSSKTD